MADASPGHAAGSPTPAPSAPTRKAFFTMTMTRNSNQQPRRLKAALIGIGLDGDGDQQRVTRGPDCLVVGGSSETHAEMREAMTRIELALEAMDRQLGELDPAELAELAFQVDLPELTQLAIKLDDGLEREGLEFEEVSADELAVFLDLEDWVEAAPR